MQAGCLLTCCGGLVCSILSLAELAGRREPVGESLRDLDQFHELEALIGTGIERDEREDHKQKAPPVDWSDVLERAEALHGQGRDLRLLVVVVRALTNERGFPGLAEGLTLMARTLEAHWDTLHPELRTACRLPRRRCVGSTR